MPRLRRGLLAAGGHQQHRDRVCAGGDHQVIEGHVQRRPAADYTASPCFRMPRWPPAKSQQVGSSSRSVLSRSRGGDVAGDGYTAARSDRSTVLGHPMAHPASRRPRCQHWARRGVAPGRKHHQRYGPADQARHGQAVRRASAGVTSQPTIVHIATLCTVIRGSHPPQQRAYSVGATSEGGSVPAIACTR